MSFYEPQTDLPRPKGAPPTKGRCAWKKERPRGLCVKKYKKRETSCGNIENYHVQCMCC